MSNCFFGSNNDSCQWILILVVIWLIYSCCCNNNNSCGCGCGEDCNRPQPRCCD